MFFLLYGHIDDSVFDNFRKISDHFVKISEDFRRFSNNVRARQKFPNIFLKIFKISKDFQRLSRKTQRCFDHTPANLHTI